MNFILYIALKVFLMSLFKTVVKKRTKCLKVLNRRQTKRQNKILKFGLKLRFSRRHVLRQNCP